MADSEKTGKKIQPQKNIMNSPLEALDLRHAST